MSSKTDEKPLTQTRFLGHILRFHRHRISLWLTESPTYPVNIYSTGKYYPNVLRCSFSAKNKQKKKRGRRFQIKRTDKSTKKHASQQPPLSQWRDTMYQAESRMYNVLRGTLASLRRKTI